MSDLADIYPSGWLGKPYYYFPSTGSTNDLAYKAGVDGEDEGSLFITDEQIKGRGRFDRTWSAPAQCCLLFSLLFRPREPFAKRANRITMACGLAMQRAIRQCGIPAKIKWPNDLIIETPTGSGTPALYGKLAGMLSEIGLIDQQPAFLVVGIGVNVNIPAEKLRAISPQAMSLSVGRGGLVSRRHVLDTFLAECESLVDALRSGYDPVSQWRDALAWLGEPVTVLRATGEEVCGTLADITDEGSLLLRLPSGLTQTFSAGDVSLRRF